MEEQGLRAVALIAGDGKVFDPGEQPWVTRATDPPIRRDHGRRARPQLAPWQAKIAREMMITQVNCGLVLTDIAARLSMSVNHFIKAFRETEGVAPYHWFMRRRIICAMALLRDDTMPLSKVAEECGFADQSHFTKAFTRLLGMPPGRWRRKVRDGLRPTA